MKTRSIIGCVVGQLLFIFTGTLAQADTPPGLTVPVVLNIWPGLAPGETQTGTGISTTSGGITRLSNVFTPTLSVYTPVYVAPDAPAVIVMPGGGYSILAEDIEGTEIASWLNSLGIVAAILDYRVPNNKQGAFQDGQRAISLLRAQAKIFGIDENKIGVIGFSAGGDLAARMATSYGSPTYPVVDDADKASNRPNFVLLIYPAYLIAKKNTIARDVDPHVGMPPVFVEQAMDDPFLDAPGYAQALADAHVPVKLVIYDFGGHGYGLRLPDTAMAHGWKEEAEQWIHEQVSGTK